MSTRSELEKEIYDFIDDCDPSGNNTARYKKLFVTMSDSEFYKYMDKFFDDPDLNFQVAYEPFNNPVTCSFINRIAKKHNIKLYEYIYKPFLNMDKENPPGTVHPVLTVDIPIKRLKQMVQSKSHTSITNNKRDATTGQVTGSDKTARITDVEAYSCIVQELYTVAQEHFGPLADNEKAMYEMLRDIQRDGEVELASLPNDTMDKVTMNAINYFLLGGCICSNIIEDSGYILPITLKGKEDDISTIKR